MLALVLPVAFVAALVLAFGDSPQPVSFRSAPMVDQTRNDVVPAMRAANAALPPADSAPPNVVERESALVGACSRIEVRDTSGAVVAGVMVTVMDGDTARATGATGVDGAMLLPTAIDSLVGASWQIAAIVPGRVVIQPLFPLTHDTTTVVTIGELGWLDVTVRGAKDTTSLSLIGDLLLLPAHGVDVHDREGVEPFDGGLLVRGQARMLGMYLRVPNDPFDVPWPGDGTNVARFRRPDAMQSWRIPVPAIAMQWAIAATQGRSKAHTFVAGPTRPGAVVKVALDVRRCRLLGRVDEASRDLVTNGAWQQHDSDDEFAVQPDGTFTFSVMRSEATVVVLANERAHLAWSVPSVDAETFDLGTITLPPRPRLGWIDVRDDRGALVHLVPDRVRATETASNARPQWRGPLPHPVAVIARDDGLEVLGAIDVAAATVRLTQRGFFLEPEEVVVANGAFVHVDCLRAARLVVHVDGAERQISVKLQDERRQEPTWVTDASIDANGQHHDFRNVRPGRYRIVANGIEGEPFVDLRSGDDREVRVTVRPR